MAVSSNGFSESAEPDNSSVPHVAPEHMALFEVVQDIHPKSGSTEGGYDFLISLSKPLTQEVTSGVAQFKGVGSAHLWKSNPHTLVGTVPFSSKVGDVEVTVLDQTGKRLGMTTFRYVDLLRETAKQLVQDKEKLSSWFSVLAQEFGSSCGGNNAAQGIGPLNMQDQGQTRQQQLLQLLLLLVYTAAEKGAQEFIEIIFSTSAGQVIFNSYKDKTPLPEDVARFNGHSNLAQYLQDVNVRLSKEVGSEVQSNVIDWLELVRAVQKEAAPSQVKSKKQEEHDSESDDNSSDYFADAETSSYGSSYLDEENQCDSDSSIDEEPSKPPTTCKEGPSSGTPFVEEKPPDIKEDKGAQGWRLTIDSLSQWLSKMNKNKKEKPNSSTFRTFPGVTFFLGLFGGTIDQANVQSTAKAQTAKPKERCQTNYIKSRRRTNAALKFTRILLTCIVYTITVFQGFKLSESYILHWAVGNGYTQNTELLLHCGLSVDAPGLFKETPLHVAAKRGFKDLADVLVQIGGNINARNFPSRETPLHLAARNGHQYIARFLIKHGSQVNARNAPWQETPLHLAARNGHQHIAKCLIQHGSQVNARTDPWGKTPLQLALQSGHKEVANILLHLGSDSSENITLGVVVEEGHTATEHDNSKGTYVAVGNSVLASLRSNEKMRFRNLKSAIALYRCLRNGACFPWKDETEVLNPDIEANHSAQRRAHREKISHGLLCLFFSNNTEEPVNHSSIPYMTYGSFDACVRDLYNRKLCQVLSCYEITCSHAGNFTKNDVSRLLMEIVWLSGMISSDQSQEDSTVISSDHSPEDSTRNSSDQSPEDSTVISSDHSTEDSTVISSDHSQEDNTVISSDQSPEDSTVISSDHSPEDSTVISSDHSQEDGTVMSSDHSQEDSTVNISDHGKQHSTVNSSGQSQPDSTTNSSVQYQQVIRKMTYGSFAACVRDLYNRKICQVLSCYEITCSHSGIFTKIDVSRLLWEIVWLSEMISLDQSQEESTVISSDHSQKDSTVNISDHGKQHSTVNSSGQSQPDSTTNSSVQYQQVITEMAVLAVTALFLRFFVMVPPKWYLDRLGMYAAECTFKANNALIRVLLLDEKDRFTTINRRNVELSCALLGVVLFEVLQALEELECLGSWVYGRFGRHILMVAFMMTCVRWCTGQCTAKSSAETNIAFILKQLPTKLGLCITCLHTVELCHALSGLLTWKATQDLPQLGPLLFYLAPFLLLFITLTLLQSCEHQLRVFAAVSSTENIIAFAREKLETDRNSYIVALSMVGLSYALLGLLNTVTIMPFIITAWCFKYQFRRYAGKGSSEANTASIREKRETKGSSYILALSMVGLSCALLDLLNTVTIMTFIITAWCFKYQFRRYTGKGRSEANTAFIREKLLTMEDLLIITFTLVVLSMVQLSYTLSGLASQVLVTWALLGPRVLLIVTTAMFFMVACLIQCKYRFSVYAAKSRFNASDALIRELLLLMGGLFVINLRTFELSFVVLGLGLLDAVQVLAGLERLASLLNKDLDSEVKRK